MMTFKHAGDRGDLIASHPVVKAMTAGQPTGALFYIEAAPYTRVMLTPDKWNGIDILLKKQKYIADVQPWPFQKMVSVNLNDFRAKMRRAQNAGFGKDQSLIDWHLDAHGISRDAKNEVWLESELNPVAEVVINRTGPNRNPMHQYHNSAFPWHRVWQKYGKKAVFIGGKDEHEAFCGACGEVPYYPTADLYEATKVIAGCKLFIGNQSCPHMIAEGLKKNIVLEVWPGGPNCLHFRPGVYHGWNQTVELPDIY